MQGYFRISLDAATAGPRASSGPDSWPVAAVAPAPVVCRAAPDICGIGRTEYCCYYCQTYHQKDLLTSSIVVHWSNLPVTMHKILGCWSYAPTNAHLGTAGRGTHWGLRAVSWPEALHGSEEVMRMSM